MAGDLMHLEIGMMQPGVLSGMTTWSKSLQTTTNRVRQPGLGAASSARSRLPGRNWSNSG
ncbi:MAG TPA: hypothetical protein VFI46_11665 [Jiangellaceae bacterium]|nr:hypothetical protein [Jiangellaceae bacterium]